MGFNLKNNTYGLILLAFIFIISGIFFISRSNGLLSVSYFDVFIWPTIGVIGIVLIANWMEGQQKLNKIFAFNENSLFVKQTPVKLLIGIGLAVLFSLGAIGLGSAIIDIPQPFTEQSLSLVSDLDRIYYQSIHPGFVEEALILFLIVQPIKFIGLAFFKWSKKNIILLYLIASAIGAGVLTQAHRIVYGSDNAAILAIFLFETVVQFFNLFTGMFISWIPHIVHNGVVSLNFLVAFSVGGVSFIAPIFIKRWRK